MSGFKLKVFELEGVAVWKAILWCWAAAEEMCDRALVGNQRRTQALSETFARLALLARNVMYGN